MILTIVQRVIFPWWLEKQIVTVFVEAILMFLLFYSGFI
ncbi:hypothetical protein HAP32_04375 [Serratia fonticola]|nr:hypothetical protein HAP32_04375 [Serratia fonticola]